jgi:hypothetical protein
VASVTARYGGLGFLALSLLSLGCGRTSNTDPDEASPSSGGAGASGVGASGVGASGGVGDATGAGGRGSATGGAGTGSKGSAGAAGKSSGGGGDDAGGSGGLVDSDVSSVDLEGTPIYTRVQRLTNRQWENAVTDILRFQERHDLAASFSRPVLDGTTFDNNERLLDVDPAKFLDFESGAEAAAAIATGSADALAALYDGTDAIGFVRDFGRRAFRRPLTPAEEVTYQRTFALGEQLYGAGFANGASLVIRAMLESPHFLYRTELGPAGEPLNSYEIASKLSFWLLGTTPSDALLDAAAAGKLSNRDAIEATARALLEDPRAVESMRDFHGQLLGVDSLQSIEKAGVPEYDSAINPELTAASYAFVDLIFQKDLGVRGLLTSKQAYVGAGLAPFYGLGDTPAEVELRDVGPSRSGFFMQVPFLMRWAQNAQSSPTQRGLHLEMAMLCRPPRPPNSEIPALGPAVQGETTRQRLTRLTEKCGESCHHLYMDPLGFAFENFDGLGRERALDNGQPVDTTGSYPFAEGAESFADGNELMKIMAESTQVHTCYSKHITSYALGRDMVEGDRPLLESMAKVSLTRSLKELVIALVRDPAFGTRKEGQP